MLRVIWQRLWQDRQDWREQYKIKIEEEIRQAINNAQDIQIPNSPVVYPTTEPASQVVPTLVPPAQALPTIESVPQVVPTIAPVPQVLPTITPASPVVPTMVPVQNVENSEGLSIAERFEQADSLQEAMSILAEARLPSEVSDSILSAWYIDRLTTRFVSESQGKRIDRDNELGVQCVDAILVFLKDYFRTESPTFKGGYPKEGFDALRRKVEAPDEIKPSLQESIVNAAGLVEIDINEGFTFRYPYNVHLLNPWEADNLNPGDIVILTGPNFAPSHVGVYLGSEEDYMVIIDQNSTGDNDGFSINKYPKSTLYGAFRIKILFSKGSPDAKG